MDKIVSLLTEIMHQGMYGEVVIKFEAGKIIIVKKTESIKI